MTTKYMSKQESLDMGALYAGYEDAQSRKEALARAEK